MQTAENKTICFGEFEIDPLHRVLLDRGRTVALKPKAFDLLLTLIESHGRVVSKNELLDRVWNNQFVEENNLTVHVAALRKALGETKNDHRYIVTVPGSGYKFVAELTGRASTEITMESHSFEHILFEEEIEVETGEQGPRPFRAPKTFFSRIIEHRVTASLIFAAMGAALIGSYFLWPRLSAGFASAHPFAGHTVRQLTTNGKVGLAALSPDGKLFTYTIDDLGQKSLWLGYVDGGNHILLRPAAESIYRTLVFAPDGKDIYFSIREEKNPKFNLYKMPAFGGVETKVLDDIGRFALSPDGKSIAIGRRDEEQNKDVLVIVPLDGSARRDAASLPRFFFDTIAWSADGNRLALTTFKEGRPITHQIAVIELSTGEIRRVEHDALREITKMRWLSDGNGLIVTAIKPESHASVPHYRIFHCSFPDGKLSLITTDRSNYGHSWHNDAGVTLSLSAETERIVSVEHRQTNNIWLAPVDDLAAARQITSGSFGRYDGLWGLDWTPGGDLIYTTSDTESQNIARIKADGTEQKNLTPTGFVDSTLTVSADGRYIVFHSNRAGGDFDIWRTDADGSNPLQLTFGGNTYQPVPSPDGQWVWYKSLVNLSGALCRVPIDGGEPEVIDTNQTSQGSFSPDGRYFAAHYVTDKPQLAVFSTDTKKVVSQFDLPKTAIFFGGTRWTPDSKAVAYRDTGFGYWIQSIDGGEPKRLDGLPKEKLYNFSWSRDGKWFAFVRGQESRDVVLLGRGE